MVSWPWCVSRPADLAHLFQAVPRVDFLDVPDVILACKHGEQSSVGVVELRSAKRKWGHLPDILAFHTFMHLSQSRITYAVQNLKYTFLWIGTFLNVWNSSHEDIQIETNVIQGWHCKINVYTLHKNVHSFHGQNPHLHRGKAPDISSHGL